MVIRQSHLCARLTLVSADPHVIVTTGRRARTAVAVVVSLRPLADSIPIEAGFRLYVRGGYSVIDIRPIQRNRCGRP